MTKYFQYLFFILVVSCASNEEKPVDKTYSSDTNRTFEMIERGGSYYLKKAPSNSVPAPQIKAQPSKRQIERPQQERQASKEDIFIDEKINYQEKSAPSPKKTKPTNAKVDERLIEINQNLAFYCMKHRKDAAYGGDEAKCMKFVNKTMDACQKKHRIVNSKLLNCIQKTLKNKR